MRHGDPNDRRHDVTDHPLDPEERRLRRAVSALGMTRDELGPEACDSLRARLSADDGDELVELLARERSADDWLSDKITDALVHRHGDNQ